MSNKSDGKSRFFALKQVVHVLAVAILFFLGLRAVNAADPQNSNIEQDLIKLENQWNQAIVKADCAFLGSIMTDDWIYTTPDGSVSDKSQFIAGFQNGNHNDPTLTNDDYRVKVYGNTAVITYHEHYTDTTAGQFRETDVWVKKGGQWKVVASHESKITG